MKRIAVVQSSYIPWKGYFDLIRRADEFILYDEVQYTRRDWRNRNRIKSPNGPLWLTIPVRVKGRYFQAIQDTKISDRRWNRRHWRSIQASYARAPYFGMYRAALEDLYLSCESQFLSEINFRFLSTLCALLSIDTPLSWSMDGTRVEAEPSERLVALCRRAGATEYLSGPSARSYIVPGRFDEAGIALTFMDYGGYPEYRQLHPPFDHHVSIIDLLVHTGPTALTHLQPLPAVTASETTTI